MTEKEQKIKNLLIARNTLEEIRIEAKTSFKTIQKVIEANGLEEFRKQVASAYKSKNASRLQTKEIIEKRSQNKRENSIRAKKRQMSTR